MQIHGADTVIVGSIAAFPTCKAVFFLVSIGRFHMTANRAGLAGMPGIHGNTPALIFDGFVLDFGAQVAERPADLLIAMLERYTLRCVTNTF